MNLEPMQFWTFLFLILTFGIYIYIAWRSRVKETKEFYVASQGVPTIANGAAVAADWMSAASFIGMAGLIAFLGSDGSVYLMGWTGGYVLLALLLAPYLRKWGKFTVPEFVGDRYSDTVRVVAAICAIVISFTYVVGQMTGGGVVFARFLGLESHWAVVVAAVVIFFYAVLGGMKGITYTQVAQYTVLIIAYLIPAVAVSQQVGGFPVPQVTYGTILAELDALREEFGLHHFTEAFAGRAGGQLDVFLVTMSLMIGTAGLPHVIIRFYTTKTVRGARFSAFWALFFISLLYLTAPAVGAFTKLNLLQGVHGATGEGDLPAWVEPWAETGHVQVHSDGVIDSVSNVEGAADMYVSPDILVLASPEIGGLPAPIIGLMAAGGMAAALSTAAGLLLVISSSASHDIYYRMISKEKASEKTQMLVGRLAMVGAVLVAIIAGLNPPAFVAQVVAFAFGLAASTFFPILILGIFWKRANAKGAAAGMLTGLVFSASYMIYTLPLFGLEANDHIWGVSPEGIGTIGAALNFLVTIVVSNLTRPPSEEVQELVESIRYPAKQQLEAAGEQLT